MNSIKKNFIYNSIYQILALIIPLITTPYVSRVLGAENIGNYSYYYSIASYFMLFIMLGLNNYGNRTIARNRDNKNVLKKTFWSIYGLQLILGIIINVAYCIFTFQISNNLIISLSLQFFVVSATFDINWLFFGLEYFKITVLRNTLIKILSTIAIFMLVKSKNDLIIYCMILSTSMLISQIILWPYVFKNIGFYLPSSNDIKIHLKPNLYLFLTVIAVSLYKVMDKIMLGFMTTKMEVGYFESSEKIIQVPIALVTSLGTVMLPRMSNLAGKDERKSNQILYYSILFAMFITTSLCFGIMGISKTFVILFYGQGYEKCVNLFLILLPSCIFLAFANVIRTQYLLPQQLDHIYIKSAFFGAVINIVANLIFIPIYDSEGAALGTLLAEIGVCFYQAYKVKSTIPIIKYVKGTMPFLTSGMVMFLVIFNLKQGNQTIVMFLIISIIMGMIVYLITLFIQFIFIQRINVYFKTKRVKE